MVLARVKGNVVATEKHPHYVGYKILVVELVGPDGSSTGKSLLALDAVQAGAGDLVLLVDEGGSARQVLGDSEAVTVRTVVTAIVDRVDLASEE